MKSDLEKDWRMETKIAKTIKREPETDLHYMVMFFTALTFIFNLY